MDKRFSRLEALIGKDNLDKIKTKNVIVFGVGGVGGFVVESLIRSGLERLTIVDNDVVDETNINRQIIATYDTVGRLKTECFKERIGKINKDCNVKTLNVFYGKDNKDILFEDKIDYVIDCCDSLESKKILIEECFKRNIPIISSMGTGNKFHPEMFSITKLKKTEYDPLAKKLRFLLKDEKELLDVDVLYSKEVPTEFKGKIGSISYVPSVAGLLLTSYVVNKFIEA